MVSFFLVVLLTTPAGAAVKAYTGDASETLLVEDAPELGKSVALIKFTGISSAWAGKVIRTSRAESPGGDTFSFEYEVELSSGKQQRRYTILVEAGNGKCADLYLPEKQKPLRFRHDRWLTERSQEAGLPVEYRKSPFKPLVE
jgi:hypothetical protein